MSSYFDVKANIHSKYTPMKRNECTYMCSAMVTKPNFG